MARFQVWGCRDRVSSQPRLLATFSTEDGAEAYRVVFSAQWACGEARVWDGLEQEWVVDGVGGCREAA